jgi:hypothetical protein
VRPSSAAIPWSEFLKRTAGIATEAHYPYLMQDHWCTASDKSSGVTLTGYVNVTAYGNLLARCHVWHEVADSADRFSEEALQDAVATEGPVAVLSFQRLCFCLFLCVCVCAFSSETVCTAVKMHVSAA